ncbi:MAG: 3-deoxy-8-phosphooctulonate synthase [candidate division Zixibacteria bacterium RBG_16_48_11]|nr:MAG: 3-deoxy-8-phosphooctulonate synthase [candidate division Zixibacteria bacterium RBG_16_48_11]
MVRSKIVKVGKIKIGGENPLVLIAGPCVIESEKLVLETAEKIVRIAAKYKIPYIFKSSYLKANRLSIDSFTGPGIKKGLKILEKVKKEFEAPVLTDVHSAEEARIAGEVADVVQVPAFLCRQTDIVLAAGKTGRAVNLKKGQFMAPEDMGAIVKKVESTGNHNILLTERGTTFGYHNLVVDMRSLVIMREIGYPVVFDATHSLQLPGAGGGFSSGQPQFIIPIARAAVACGCDALFVETHPDVKNALSDAKSMLPLEQLDTLLSQVTQIDRLVKEEFTGERKSAKKTKKD